MTEFMTEFIDLMICWFDDLVRINLQHQHFL